MTNQFTEDYFIRGQELKLSNYTDYRWMEERTISFARRLIEVIGIKATDTFLDYGCARGYTVKAMRQMYIDAWGYDISQWAIENCDPDVVGRVHNYMKHGAYDHVLLKDVTEHVEPIDLMKIVDSLLATVRKSILLIVPLSYEIGGPYVRAEDSIDVTHVIKWPLEKWMDFLQNRVKGDEWSVSGSWNIPGLKPTSLSHPKSCGFLTLRRSSQAKTSGE